MNLAERENKKPNLFNAEKGRQTFEALVAEPGAAGGGRKMPSVREELMRDSLFRSLTSEEQEEIVADETARRKAKEEARMEAVRENTRRLFKQQKEKKERAFFASPEGQAQLKKQQEDAERARVEEAERTAKPSGYEGLPKKVIDGHTYRYDMETGLLYDYRDDMGEERLGVIGRFRPGNEDDPIRFFDLDRLGEELLDN